VQADRDAYHPGEIARCGEPFPPQSPDMPSARPTCLNPIPSLTKRRQTPEISSASLPVKPAKKVKASSTPAKRVFAITTVEPGTFAFAGIWDSWKRPDGTRLETFALVTTEPNELVAQIHDRLALILHPETMTACLAFPRVAIRGLRSIC
jgi:hypothetical protein